jgi:hypothetical protein
MLTKKLLAAVGIAGAVLAGAATEAAANPWHPRVVVRPAPVVVAPAYRPMYRPVYRPVVVTPAYVPPRVVVVPAPVYAPVYRPVVYRPVVWRHPHWHRHYGW